MARRPRSAPQHVTPLTLGDLRVGGVKHIEAECDWCRHEGSVDLASLIEKAGVDAAYREMARHFVCSVCGWRRVSAWPIWPGRGSPTRPKSKPSPLPSLSECRALVEATAIDPGAELVDRRDKLMRVVMNRWPELTASAALFVIQTLETERLLKSR